MARVVVTLRAVFLRFGRLLDRALRTVVLPVLRVLRLRRRGLLGLCRCLRLRHRFRLCGHRFLHRGGRLHFGLNRGCLLYGGRFGLHGLCYRGFRRSNRSGRLHGLGLLLRGRFRMRGRCRWLSRFGRGGLVRCLFGGRLFSRGFFNSRRLFGGGCFFGRCLFYRRFFSGGFGGRFFSRSFLFGGGFLFGISGFLGCHLRPPARWRPRVLPGTFWRLQ